jgi:hypothetical protein
MVRRPRSVVKIPPPPPVATRDLKRNYLYCLNFIDGIVIAMFTSGMSTSLRSGKEQDMIKQRGPLGRFAVTVLIAVTTMAGHAAVLADPEGPWIPMIRQVDHALARKEYSAALRAANEAYALALGTTRWDGMVCAGDLYRRIGEATGLRRSFEDKARETYQKAFFRARQQGSVEGVLRATEGYAALGDAQMVGLGLRVAERLAARDPEARADVRAFRARLGDPSLAAGEAQR